MKAKALFYVLNNADKLHDLLDELRDAGIRGGTIFDSNGMGRELARHGDSINSFNAMTGSLRSLIKPELKDTKTIMFVLDEEKIEEVIAVIEKVVGSLDEPGTGVAFAFPIDFIKGLKL